MLNNIPIEGLTDITQKLVDIIYFKSQKTIVINILNNECGNNLPLCEDWTSKQLERIRFAVIKLSEGQLDKFQYAVKLANIDWRDLLVEAGFAHDINYHNEWANKIIGIENLNQ